MTIHYADTSALARAFFPDEPGHRELRQMLLDGHEYVVTSELARLEFRRATFAAHRDRRLTSPTGLLERFDATSGDHGSIGLIALEPQPVLGLATQLVERHPLRTLDAIHLAVAIEESVVVAPDDDLVFVTRDDRQAEAAEAEGLAVA